MRQLMNWAVERDRFLSMEDVAKLWEASAAPSPISSAFIHVLLLTGQRRETVAQMRRSQIEDGTMSCIPMMGKSAMRWRSGRKQSAKWRPLRAGRTLMRLSSRSSQQGAEVISNLHARQRLCHRCHGSRGPRPIAPCGTAQTGPAELTSNTSSWDVTKSRWRRLAREYCLLINTVQTLPKLVARSQTF